MVGVEGGAAGVVDLELMEKVIIVSFFDGHVIS